MVLTSVRGDDDRGQVLLLTAVLLCLIVLSAVTVANGSFLAADDISTGVTADTPETIQATQASETAVQSALISSNRRSTSFSTAFSQAESSLANNAQYNGLFIDMSLKDTLSGTRIHGEYIPNTTDNETVIASGTSPRTVGSISIDVTQSTLPTTSTDAFTVIYGSNTVEVYRSGSDTVTVTVTNGGTTTYTITDPPEKIVLDLGVGRFGGYLSSEYDTTAGGTIEVYNSDTGSNRVFWAAEFVSDTGGTAEVPNMDDTAALYGAVYNVEVQSQRSHMQTTRFVTHAPTPAQKPP
jgi:hypothetical protein